MIGNGIGFEELGARGNDRGDLSLILKLDENYLLGKT